eukprot:TRINITY_DN1093_c0_g3_i1.p1 TRINITY_DN1093_c0_g3~~TRINITY_DN1093_c0_g3_i1.p1  ORF type:complete len:217 (+),score=76.70 TRINITY_DN1093_c0_g3_i1:58-708(+)
MGDDVEMEIMALESIFGDELKILSENKKIMLEVADPDADPDSATRLELKVEFTDDYPNEHPIVTCRAIRGLTRAQVDPLPRLLKEHCEDLMGEPMVYEMTTFIQEWIQNGAQVMSKGDDAAPEATQKIVIESRSKHGIPVTTENFNEWLEKFMTETSGQRRQVHLDPTGNVKLSGKQFFDKTINSVDWELFGDGDEPEDLPSDDDDDDDNDDDDEE